MSEKKRLWRACLLSAIMLIGLLTGCGSPSPAAAQATETAAPAAQATDGFTVKLLSTGKSDCAILYMDGLVIVNDTADADDANTIISALKADDVSRIDYMILSHYDKDHIGSAAALLEGFAVGTVLRQAHTEESAEYEALVAAEKKRGVPVVILKEDYTIETANGFVTVDPPNTDYGDDNNNSAVTTVSYREHRLLFLGDAKKKRIEEYLDTAQGGCDFVKLPHHGDWNKALESLLRRSAPRWAAATVLSSEDVAPELAAQLKELGAALLCTSDGTVRIQWNGEALAVEQLSK